MNKQCDLFNGSKLNAFEKYDLEKERKEKKIKDFFCDIQIVEDKKCKVKEVVAGDFIRTVEEVLQVKYKMRGLFVCISIVTEKELWVEEKAILKSSNEFFDVLSSGDRLLFRNDNGILLEGAVDMIYKNKKGVYKIIIQDIKDREILCFEKLNVVRVLKVFNAERSNNVR